MRAMPRLLLVLEPLRLRRRPHRLLLRELQPLRALSNNRGA